MACRPVCVVWPPVRGLRLSIPASKEFAVQERDQALRVDTAILLAAGTDVGTEQGKGHPTFRDQPREPTLGNAQVLPRDVQRHMVGVFLSQFIRFLLVYILVLLSPCATAQKPPYFPDPCKSVSRLPKWRRTVFFSPRWECPLELPELRQCPYAPPLVNQSVTFAVKNNGLRLKMTIVYYGIL